LRSRYETVYNVFQLAATLYLPQDGRGEGLLGEELLDWLNDVDPRESHRGLLWHGRRSRPVLIVQEPDNSQGNEIMQSRNPWEHPSFWPYITRCILRGFQLPAASLLRTLQTHPHPPIAELGPLLAAHLTLMPRSHNTTAYPLDHQFLHAHRTWLAKFRAELAAFMGGRGRGRYLDGRKEGGEDWSAWEADIRTVVELMEGKSDRLLEEAADWREAIGAYGILCDAGLRRDDLP
jgi:nuclear pore complex protein Nup85